jgi:hypothetical protein
MTQVAPSSAGQYSENIGPIAGSGPGKGNGCCCACLGGNPGSVPTDDITKAGGKFVNVDNDRIIEYYTYGSTRSDAKCLLTFGGNFSTGYVFGTVKELSTALNELNVKGISISLPGVGFTSQNYGANLSYFAKYDVGAVLEAEGVSKMMVEGMSNGSIVAMCVAYYHLDKLEGLHLMVPFISTKVAAEENLPNPLDDYLPGQAKCCGPGSTALLTCCPGSCIFCCMSCLSSCCSCSSEAKQHPDISKELPDLGKITCADIKRSYSHYRASMCLSQVASFPQNDLHLPFVT